MTHEDIFNEFCNWSPNHAAMVTEYRPWGSTSILVRLNNDTAYKVKRYDANKFIMQPVSEDDIQRKYSK